MMRFRRSGSNVFVNGEQFLLDDLIAMYPNYEFSRYQSHYYDGKKHYVSDGVTQKGLPIPYQLVEELQKRMPELKMCRSQRLNDHKYFENLRNGRR